MQDIFGSLDFASLLQNGGGRLFWPGEQNLEERIRAAAALSAALAAQGPDGNLGRFVYVMPRKLETLRAPFVLREQKDLPAQAGLSPSFTTSLAFLQELQKVNEELDSMSMAVIMDAECIRDRDGFRLLVELEAMGKRLAQGPGGNGTVLVLAVFGRSPVDLSSFFRPEHVVGTWEPSAELLRDENCLRHSSNVEGIEGRGDWSPAVAAAVWEHLRSLDEGTQATIIFDVDKQELEVVLFHLRTLAGESTPPTIADITWQDVKAHDEVDLINILHVEGWRSRHAFVRIDKKRMSYAMSLACNVTLVIGKINIEFGESFDLDYYRVCNTILPLYLDEMRMVLQLVYGDHRWANQDALTKWISPRVNVTQLPIRSCATLKEDIKWTALSVCGSTYMPQGCTSDLWECLKSDPFGVDMFGRIWDRLRRMGLVVRKDGDPAWETSPSLIALENELLCAPNLGRTYPASSAALWVRAKGSNNAVVQRLLIRMGAIIALEFQGLQITDDVPHDILATMCQTFGPYCLGKEQQGFHWFMLGVYERTLAKGLEGMAGAYGGLPEVAGRPAFALIVARSWFSAMKQIVATVEGLCGLEPAEKEWICKARETLQVADLDAVYDGLASALVDNMVARGLPQPAPELCHLLEDTQAARVRTGHFVHDTYRTTVSLQVAHEVIYNATDEIMVVRGMTFLPINYLETHLR